MSPTLRQLGIDRLSVAERLALIGEIWDSIEPGGLEPTLPSGHQAELERRRAAAEADPGAGIPWEDVQKRLQQRP